MLHQPDQRTFLANGIRVCESFLDPTAVNRSSGWGLWFRGGVSEPRQHHLKAGIRDRKQIRTACAGGTEQKSGDGLPLRPALIFLR
jgi:hypothetical protein